MPNEICPTIINMIDEIKEKISNAEYKKICDELKVIHEKQKSDETEYYSMEYEIIETVTHAFFCDCCQNIKNLTSISQKLCLCVPCIKKCDENDKLNCSKDVLIKIFKDGFVHECNLFKAINFLEGHNFDINCSLTASEHTNDSDEFDKRKIVRVISFSKIVL
tara:strand:+ start:172 stop:660 length:489 start_codon:yes stop_codon:yes gene_type:complete